MLKKTIQTVLDRYRASKLDQLDWITQNRLVLDQGKKVLQASAKEHRQKTDRKKVLLWGVMPWERGGVEHMLAKSLIARGHQVHGVKCTGDFSACSMESTLYPRPSCEECVVRHDRLLDSMGLQEVYQPINRYISDEEREAIAKRVDESSLEELREMVVEGIPVGKMAYDDLPQYYFKLVQLEDPEVLAYYRRAVKGVAQYTFAAARALDEIQPDRAMTTSGRTVAFGGFYQLCRLRNIPVATWDESVGGLGAFIFCFNDMAVNYSKPSAWAKMSQEPLTKEEESFIEYYFSKSSKGLFGRHAYYKAPITEKEALMSDLGLSPEKKLTVLLTNLTWDTSALNKDVGFESMFDWLSRTIDHYYNEPNHQIVIRTHPAEGHADTFARGCESVSGLISQKYPKLPSHIRVVSGKEEHSSHTLAELADNIVVYTTTVAMEMAARGRNVMVAGLSHYREKGFTTDIETPEKYFEILDSEDPLPNLSEEQIHLAKKYAYYFIVRTEVYLPEFNFKDRHYYKISEASDFLPGGAKHWDELCRNVEEVGDFVDCSDFIDPWKT